MGSANQILSLRLNPEAGNAPPRSKKPKHEECPRGKTSQLKPYYLQPRIQNLQAISSPVQITLVWHLCLISMPASSLGTLLFYKPQFLSKLECVSAPCVTQRCFSSERGVIHSVTGNVSGDNMEVKRGIVFQVPMRCQAVSEALHIRAYSQGPCHLV